LQHIRQGGTGLPQVHMVAWICTHAAYHGIDMSAFSVAPPAIRPCLAGSLFADHLATLNHLDVGNSPVRDHQKFAGENQVIKNGVAKASSDSVIHRVGLKATPLPTSRCEERLDFLDILGFTRQQIVMSLKVHPEPRRGTESSSKALCRVDGERSFLSAQEFDTRPRHMDVLGELPGTHAHDVEELVLENLAVMDRYFQHGHGRFLLMVVYDLDRFRPLPGPKDADRIWISVRSSEQAALEQLTHVAAAIGYY
jgi:hypothetical protein